MGHVVVDLPEPPSRLSVLNALEMVQGYVGYLRVSQQPVAFGKGKRRAVPFPRGSEAAAALADSGLSAADRARLSQAGRDLDVARRRDVARAFGVLDW